MFAIAVGVLTGSYWLFHYGYYFAKGAPIAPLDDILPSRRATFLAAIEYMRQGNFSAASAPAPTILSTTPGTSATNTLTGASPAPPQVQQPIGSGG